MCVYTYIYIHVICISENVNRNTYIILLRGSTSHSSYFRNGGPGGGALESSYSGMACSTCFSGVRVCWDLLGCDMRWRNPPFTVTAAAGVMLWPYSIAFLRGGCRKSG